MKILSFGAGMQSTALALMSCENVDAERKGHERPYPLVPVYDLVVFCDLGFEPPWVMQQAEFVHRACDTAGIRYEMLDAPLHRDLMQNFGRRRTVSIPWWTLRDDGHKSRMPRNCTLDYKVERISKFVRWEVLGYKKGQRLRDEDKKAHEMHMGFSFEEKQRCKDSPNPMFVNRFPLVDMELTRADNYGLHTGCLGTGHQGVRLLLLPVPPKLFLREPQGTPAADLREAAGGRRAAEG